MSVSTADAPPLRHTSEIEEQLTCPGHIKVTVIRETRAVEYAK